MKDYTKFVGLDVSKDSISVAVADTGRGEPRFLGNIPHTGLFRLLISLEHLSLSAQETGLSAFSPKNSKLVG